MLLHLLLLLLLCLQWLLPRCCWLLWRSARPSARCRPSSLLAWVLLLLLQRLLLMLRWLRVRLLLLAARNVCFVVCLLTRICNLPLLLRLLLLLLLPRELLPRQLLPRHLLLWLILLLSYAEKVRCVVCLLS